jgi:oligopeptide/dipeptide ABC transporter ATP-binding protein
MTEAERARAASLLKERIMDAENGAAVRTGPAPMQADSSIVPLLEVRNLTTTFTTEDGSFNAVDGVSFLVDQGETLGIVGESGCGKSVTALSILRLVPNPPGLVSGGEILFRGEDLLKKPKSAMKKIRGKLISMIFQDPMTSLNPLFRVGEQIEEVLRLHKQETHAGRSYREEVVHLLELVGIAMPEKRIDEYPHQLSGGMRQRVMIAMALACRPRLLIADEPTTALDVTIQAQILDLMKEMRDRTGSSIIMITHDLGVIAEMADRVLVMYAGQVVEEAPVKELFASPLHPYTVGLMGAIPRIGGRGERLTNIPGVVPSLLNLPEGCRFAPRCTHAREVCRNTAPELLTPESGRIVRCHRYNRYLWGGDAP